MRSPEALSDSETALAWIRWSVKIEAAAAVVREQEPGDDGAVVSVSMLNYPEFPQGSEADYRFTVESWKKFGRNSRRWVAEVDGEVVAFALVLEIKSTWSEPGLFWSEIEVLEANRRHGLGGKLYDVLVDEAVGLGGRKLLGEVLDSHHDGQAFAAKRGFVLNEGHGEQLARLDVRQAVLTGFEEAESYLKSQGLRMERTADFVGGDAARVKAIYRLDMDTHRDVPSPIEWVDIPFEEWFEVIYNGPGRSPQWAWVVLDGVDPVGMARLRLYGRDGASNAYTGVRGEYRGRGIARALKHRTVTWCRENGINWIFTGNSVENARMLAINRSLGYRPLPRSIEIVRDIP
jgi:GNAT superfamily N-acetyltransferase